MRLTLSRKIWASFIGILFLAVLSSGIALLSAWRTEAVYKDLISKNLEQARALSELEISWLEQGGLISFYLLDGQQKWIDELHQKRPDFEIWLEKTSKIGLEANQQKLFEEISENFSKYKSQMERVITLADQNKLERAKQLWIEKAGVSHDNIYDLCERLSSANDRDIEKTIDARRNQIKKVHLWISVFTILLVGTIIGIVWSLLSGVFWPLKALRERVHRDDGNKPDPVSSVDDIRTLGTYIDNLKDEVAEMRIHLSLSQRRLIDAEKLASIGKLAATVAHEIRSPLTSLRLRLFSLQKAFEDHQRQKDFTLISEEISRLDNIVSNFLDFSRPRPLNLGECRLDELLDRTMELMNYKLEAASISIQRQIEPDLPPVIADSQQLQQVFVNLLNNSIDALTDGGVVRIIARQKNKSSEKQRIAEVLVSDDGSGIAYDVQERLFEPYFGTKSDSTGLGLWIARKIMLQHKGDIELRSSTPRGTIFALWIPTIEKRSDE